MNAPSHLPPIRVCPRKGPLLLLPARWQRPVMLATLKRLHAWTGLWGAALFLLLGTSGFLLNHRNILPIETGKPVELAEVRLPVRPDAIPTEEALGIWARATLDLTAEPKPLPAKPDPETARFLGRNVTLAPEWGRVFTLPNQKVTVTYVPGAPFVSAKREAVNALGILKNLHKGTGLGIAWILLIDTIAGALIAMSLTGTLLWSRLHGPRLLAATLAGGAIAWAMLASVPLFG